MSADTNPIYLDNAAATPLDPRVLAAMMPYFETNFYNPSALYQPARQVKQAIDQARALAAKQIGVKPLELTFTAGATESINLLISGVMKRYGGELVTSSIEHEAVLQSAAGFDTAVVDADLTGYISVDAITRAISAKTTLVTIGYVNNELGTIQSLKAIAEIVALERQRRLRSAETHPLYFHTDASQAVGLLDISVSRLGVDAMTLNASKCYGPKQVGLLYKSSDIELKPLIAGGGQENGLRSGTENVAGIIGFAKALELAGESRKKESHRIAMLRDRLQSALEKQISDIHINGSKKRRAPHILHVSVPGMDGERAVFALDNAGILAATGSACAANRETRSHVLQAVGMEAGLADGSLRFSLGRYTTENDIERAGTSISEVLKKERYL